jgi:hypothetical protein
MNSFLNLLQKLYLNVLSVINLFNFGIGSIKNTTTLKSFSSVLVFYFFVYVLIIFIGDKVLFNEEFFVSVGLVLFILFIRIKITALLIPFFSQQKLILENTIRVTTESIYSLSIKLLNYFTLELFFIKIIKKNGFTASNNINLVGTNLTFKNTNIFIFSPLVNKSSDVFGVSSFKSLNFSESTVIKLHLIYFFKKMFSAYVHTFFLNFFFIRYSLRNNFIELVFKKKLFGKKKLMSIKSTLPII